MGAYQDSPRLRPRQSSSPPDTSTTTPPAVIIPPPRAPEPELPAVAQPASPPPAQPPLPRILLQRSGNDWRIANQHNIQMLSPLPYPFPQSHCHWPLLQSPAHFTPPPPQHFQTVNSLLQTCPWHSHLPSYSPQ